VPKQPSTGGQTRLLGISKRGESYVRKLLIHGARATLRWVQLKTDERSRWMRGLLARCGWHRTAVAVANTHARLVWALLSRGGGYGDNASSSGGQALWRLSRGRRGASRQRQREGCDQVKASTKITQRVTLSREHPQVERACCTMRGVSAVMTREVRPAFPNPEP
jgi:hypothetical protein